MKYNKLVRDLIPDIIREKGEVPVIEILDEDKFYVALRSKLIEEANEFAAKPSLEELADVMEVVDALLGMHGWTRDELLAAQEKKRGERGAFMKRILLVEA